MLDMLVFLSYPREETEQKPTLRAMKTPGNPRNKRSSSILYNNQPKPPPKSPKRGRPETRVLKIDATPEFLAKCIVTPVKKPK